MSNNTQTKTRKFELAWIVVNDFEKALDFYTKVVGLEIETRVDEAGWAELRGNGGAYLGIAKQSAMNPVKAGSNAIVTITVDDIKVSRDELAAKGVKLLGDIMEVPGECKLQMFADNDENLFQLVQLTRG